MAGDALNKALEAMASGAFNPTAAPAPSADRPSLVEQATQQAASAVKRQRAVAVIQGTRADPDRYQADKSIADAFGVGVDFVERNRDRLDEINRRNELGTILDKSPQLADWYVQGDNPASIKRDELEHLGGLEWLWSSAVASFSSGQDQVELGRLRQRQMNGLATPEEIDRANTISATMGQRDFGADGWLEQGWTGAWAQIPVMGNSILQASGAALATGTGFAGIAALGGQLGPQVALPEEIITVPGAFVSGVTVGGVWGSWNSSFQMESGLAFDEFLQFTDENGQPLDEDVARVAAVVAGMGAASLETVADVALAKILPGVDKLFGGGAKATVKAALRQPSVRQALKDFAGNIFKAGATEITTEVMQEAVTVFTGEVAKTYANTTGAEFTALTPEQVGERLMQAATQTAQVMTILGPVLAGTRLGADVKRARSAKQGAAIMEALAGHAEESELLKRLPEKARQAIKAMTANGPLQHVFISPDGLRQYFQDDPNALGEFAQQLGIVDEVNEALATGRDIQVPIETYYVNIAGTEIHEAIKDFVRVSQEAMTTNEADQFNEAWAEAVASLQADYEAQVADERQALAGEEVVFNDVKERAMAAGITPDQAQQYAKLYSTFFRVMAERADLDPDQLYQRYGLDIRRALPGDMKAPTVDSLTLDLAAIRAGKVEPMRKNVQRAAGPSLLAFLRRYGGIEDDGGELAAMGLKGKIVRKPRNKDAGMAGEPGDNRYSADYLARHAWESGYFPDRQEAPTPNELYDAMREEVGGNARYSVQMDQRSRSDIQRQAGLVAFADLLDELGLDATSLSDDEVRAELERLTNADPNNAALAQFAGLRSNQPDANEPGRLSPSPSFAMAHDMEKTGADRDAIFELTGWFRGYDGKWRYEISDADAELDLDVFKEEEYAHTDIRGGVTVGLADDLDLGMVLNHKKLFDAYPQLSDITVELTLDPKAEKEFSGSYTRESKKIVAEARDPATLLSVVLHEVAHAIQDIEGFNTGGNLQSGELMDAPEVKKLEKLVAVLAERYAKAKAEAGDVAVRPKAVQDAAIELVNAQQQLRRAAQYAFYKRIDGEVEARNVQTRDAERRKGIDVDSDGPWWTQDVPEDEIIVVRSDAHGQAFEAMGPGDPEEMREFYQEAPGSDTGGQRRKRGSIQFGEGVTIINMFEAANLSTFLHESGHFFLEVFRDLATADNATDALKADWQELVKYLGVDDPSAISEDAHEKFARSFEAYLFEGKEPSDDVAGIMARFRSWLVFVYKQIDALRAPINDKIRGVMDRMLATDQEIARATTAPEFRPAFKDAADAGMTPEQWEKYLDAAGKAVNRAKRELDAKMMAELARETTREWRTERKRLRETVRAQLEKVPVYQVINYLRTGSSDVVPADVPRMYLDRDAIVSLMGDGALLRIPRSVPPIYREKGGVHPDVLAEMFGFKSGHEMLTRMMSAAPLGRAIVEEVNVQMRQRFGDLMGDANARLREAEAAMANDDTGELLNVELEVLMRKGLVATKLNKEAAQRAARRMIREKPVRDATRLRLYMNANAKAAQETERAIMKGDWPAAVQAKQRQLLNHYLTIEARQAQKDSEKAQQYLSKFTGRKRVKGIAAEYLEQIEGLLERFDMRKSVGTGAARRRQSLREWIETQEAAGLVVSVPDALRDDAFRKPYRDMTVDDLMGLADSVRSIEHIGRTHDKLRLQFKAERFAAVRDEVLGGIIAGQDRQKENDLQNPSKGEQVLSGIKGIDAALLKMEQLITWMDGGDINGPMRRHVWQRIANAEVRENDMRVTYTGKIFEIMSKLDKKRLAEKITVAQVATTFERSEILALALNLGNEGNKGKLLASGNGKGPWTEADLAAITSHLDAAEWQAVQDMWDAINELWPEIEALQKRLSGVAPPKIEAIPVVTPYGTLRGGYYPIIYDPRRAADVADRADVAAGKLFENTYLKPETQHGFTKERVKYERPLLLDLDRAASHIIAVIHDVSHREAIMDAHKLLTDPAIRAEIEARYGREVYQQFVPWLQSIANDNVKNDGLKGPNAALRGIRSRATMVGMGFRISTILTQVAGLSSAMEMVSPRFMAMGLAEFVRNPMAAWQRVNAASGEMRHRGKQMDRDIRDELRRLAGKTGGLDAARKFAFHGIGYMDKVVTVPTWLGAYAQHLKAYPGDVDGATAFADRAIRLSQGGGGAKDLAAIQRQNEGTKLVTMFYSYFSAYYNRQRTWGRDAKRAIQRGDYADFPSLLARQVFMTIGPAVLSQLLVGQGPGDDETWPEWVLKKIALYPFMAVPIVRDAVNAMDSGYGYTFSPAGRTVQELGPDMYSTLKNLVEGDADPRQVVKQVITTTGYALNLPTGQLATTVDNVWLAIEEDDLSLRDFVLNRPKQ